MQQTNTKLTWEKEQVVCLMKYEAPHWAKVTVFDIDVKYGVQLHWRTTIFVGGSSSFDMLTFPVYYSVSLWMSLEKVQLSLYN